MASTFLPVLSVPVKKNTDTKKNTFKKKCNIFVLKGARQTTLTEKHDKPGDLNKQPVPRRLR